MFDYYQVDITLDVVRKVLGSNRFPNHIKEQVYKQSLEAIAKYELDKQKKQEEQEKETRTYGTSYSGSYEYNTGDDVSPLESE